MPTRAQLSKAAEAKDGHTSLMIAALEGDKETVDALLPSRELNAKDKEGRTALMFAVVNSHVEIVKVLLRAGARVNARARDGGTALMLAVANGDVEIVRILLKHGAKTGYRYTATGKSAITLATERRHDEVLKLLQKRLPGEDHKTESAT